jgi:hypothetical protein
MVATSRCWRTRAVPPVAPSAEGDTSRELLQGTLEVLLLKVLSWGPQHGYGVAELIRMRSGEALKVEEGALYPALHRLERRGWVEAEWGVSENIPVGSHGTPPIPHGSRARSRSTPRPARRGAALLPEIDDHGHSLLGMPTVRIPALHPNR